MSTRAHIVAVVGGGHCSPETAGIAEEVGRGIAERGAILICGGLRGVMEAACRGARAAGGTTIGVLPGTSKTEANQFVDIAIPTGFAEARNVIIIRSADAVIAIDGEYGTLSEVAFALKFGKPVVGLNTWRIDENIALAASASEAVELAFDFLQ